MGADLRRIALRLLESWERDETYLNLSMNSRMTRELSRSERAFLTGLLYGTVERRITLDYLISVAAKRSEIDPDSRNILRLGFYQLFFMDRVPPFAAVSETVSLADGKGKRAFINGVLRGALRTFVNESGERRLPLPPREKNLARYLSIAYSYPTELVRHFLSFLGEKETEELLSVCNETAPLTLTVNTQRITREGLLSLFAEREIRAERTERSPRGVRVLDFLPVSLLPGFDEGLFFVQDEASQLGSAILSPRRGELLVDPCACPGGKSFSAALSMGDLGQIYSFDLHESKLPLITDGAARLGLNSLSVGERDAREPDPSLLGKADAVHCDVPCSGLGVLRKKPDLRYRFEGRGELPALQLEILTASAAYLKEGGRLLYSTCTLNPAENEGVFEQFLAKNPDFEPCPFEVADLSAPTGQLTLYPHRHGCDGFFYALARKKTHPSKNAN